MFQPQGHGSFVTTVGQLNFSADLWKANIDTIEKDMNTSMREHYGSTNSSSSEVKTIVTASTSTQSSDSSTRRKRSELSKSALKKVNLHQCHIVVSFG